VSDPLPIDPADISMDLTDLGTCERRLVMTVPARLVKRFHKKLKKAGEDATDENAGRRLINFCVEQGLKRFGIEPIWGPVPTADVQPKFKLGSDFEVSVDVDDSPAVTWPDFATLEVIRPTRDITDELIDGEMAEQQRDAGTRAPLAGPLDVDDEIVCRVEVVEPGSDMLLHASEEEVTIRVRGMDGPASFFGIPIDRFGAAVIGKTAGNTVQINAQLPKDYVDPTLAGSGVTVEIEICEARRIQPATVEEVVEQYGSPSEAILRRQIRLSLEQKVQQDQLRALSQQVFARLGEIIDVPLPHWAVSQYRNHFTASIRTAMKKRGCDESAIAARLADQEDRITEVAMEQGKRRALSNLLGRHLEIRADEQAIIGQIAEMAAAAGRRPEDLRKEIMASGRLQGVAIAVIEGKSVDKILESANITDVPADEWSSERISRA
jgi:FKBP-type peptidyl-prolyl cis-trans isomerase (trigger factor)